MNLQSINKPSNEAYWGLAGSIVTGISPHTEADSMGLLSQLLAAFGNSIGRSSHVILDGAKHCSNLFVINVGKSSKGRKGTAWAHIENLFKVADSDWSKNNIGSGLSSGEGLISRIRDPDPEGVLPGGGGDKRLFCIESEFASLLRVLGRDGNTISPNLRNAWDGRNLSTLTKSPIKVTDPHISIVGHITKTELHKLLNDNEIGNGLGNRFLFFYVERSKLLPFGGQIDSTDFRLMSNELKSAIEFGRVQGEIGLTENAKVLWADVYNKLAIEVPGVVGTLSSRGEAQIRRLAMIQALINKRDIVDEDCLRSAIAIHDYCLETLKYLYGGHICDPIAEKIRKCLREAPNGLSRSNIRDIFRNNVSKISIESALAVLESGGFARKEIIPGKGIRSVEKWFSLEFNTNDVYDQYDLKGANSNLDEALDEINATEGRKDREGRIEEERG